MRMKLQCFFCFVFAVWIGSQRAASMQDVYFRAINPSERSLNSSCDNMQIIRWRINFHDCFMTRKLSDGGQELESIVDRVLGHAEACVETSSSNCVPDYKGFQQILNKVFEQMKDYTSMYLEEIIKGREKIKDLKCVEDTLSLESYSSCFNHLQPPSNKSAPEFKDRIKDGIKCTNDAHIECSKEARTSLNRIVRNIFSLEQPPEEGDMPVKEPPPPPKRWYNYITDPIVAAWESVKKFFSNLFG